MAPHSSTLAWKIPWTEEPGRLQPMGSLGVGHDWANSLSLFTFMPWRRKWQLLQCSCLENPRDGEPSGLPSLGSHRVRHDWSDLAAVYIYIYIYTYICIYISCVQLSLLFFPSCILQLSGCIYITSMCFRISLVRLCLWQMILFWNYFWLTLNFEKFWLLVVFFLS